MLAAATDPPRSVVLKKIVGSNNIVHDILYFYTASEIFVRLPHQLASGATHEKLQVRRETAELMAVA